MVKNRLAMQEALVRSLGQEDSLAKEMATHSSLLAWRIPRTEEPGGLQSMGAQRVRQDLATEQHQHWRWGKLLKNAVAGPHPTLNYTGPRGEAECLHFQSAFWMLLTHYRAWSENALNAIY